MLSLLVACALFSGKDARDPDPKHEDTGPVDVDTDVVDTDVFAVSEDCSDGDDNDADGLVDCEDGDCAGVVPCAEDCESREDDDGDGLTNCADDECLGTAHCPFIEVTDGWLYHERRANPGWTYAWYVDYVGAHDVSGVIRFESSSCDWSLNSTRWTHRQTLGQPSGALLDETLTKATRAGFAIDPACAVQTSGFLHRRLMMTADMAHVPTLVPTAMGELMYAPLSAWYAGSVTSSGPKDYGGASIIWFRVHQNITAAGYAR